MDVDGEPTPSPQRELLVELAAGGSIENEAWPELRTYITEQIDKISHDAFPIPKLPLPQPIVRPRTDSQGRLVTPPQSSSVTGSEDTDKENAPQGSRPGTAASAAPEVQEPAEGELPVQLQEMLDRIVAKIAGFAPAPPHTIQRLSELVLEPKRHYRSVATYLHAVNRVVGVTSGTDTYPLPPAIPDMSGLNGGGDPAMQVNWSNPVSHQIPVGSDEALGGALLTPIPWLTKRGSPESGAEAASNSSGGSNSNSSGSGSGSAPGSASGSASGAQIVSEGTETIDGPNGVGSVETVSVSVNGVPSTGAARGITQGELLRQEQRAGVVPMNQITRQAAGGLPTQMDEDDDDDDGEHSDDDDETPHARGPEEIGVGDTGPQRATSSHHHGEGMSLETGDLDLEAAVGRKHEEPAEETTTEETKAESEEMDTKSPAPSEASAGVKREADDEVEGEPAKKAAKDGSGDGDGDGDGKGKDGDDGGWEKIESEKEKEEEKKDGGDSKGKEGSGDEMDTSH